jgi:hypothetical protein
MAWSMNKFFERFWGEPADRESVGAKMIRDRNRIVKKAGEEFQKKIYDRKATNLFIRGVEKNAKKYQVDPRYIYHSIFYQMDNWPVMPEYLERALETIYLIFKDEGILPNWEGYSDVADPNAMDNAIKSVAVVAGRLVDIYQSEYIKVNTLLAPEIIPFLNKDPKGNPLSAGQASAVLCKLLENAIIKHPMWFRNPHTLHKLMRVFTIDTPDICRVFK